MGLEKSAAVYKTNDSEYLSQATGSRMRFVVGFIETERESIGDRIPLRKKFFLGILVYNRSMKNRQKILILESDDFLREIIGNLLHKRGGYILNGSCIQDGLDNVRNNTINTVILGTSCSEYKGKETLRFITKNLDQKNNPDFFIINHTNKKLDFIASNKQMTTDNLSIEKILETIPV